MLHTVNKSPFEKNSLDTCLRLAKSGSSILLIEDGIYGAIKGSDVAEKVSAALSDKKIYALAPDLKARGIQPENIIDGIETIDYDGFVKLAAESSNVQSWL